MATWAEFANAEPDLAADWLRQFERWLRDAIVAGLPEPNAMVLATASPDGAVNDSPLPAVRYSGVDLVAHPCGHASGQRGKRSQWFSPVL